MRRSVLDKDVGAEAYSDQVEPGLLDLQATRPGNGSLGSPDMVRGKLPDGDHRVFTVNIRDAEHRMFHLATLALRAEWRSGAGACRTCPP